MPQVEIKKKVLARNDEIADSLRQEFGKQGLLVLNIVSSPGSGKTSLLEQTIKADKLTLAVLIGDLQTENDANRLRTAGLENTEQITTNGICHLDASMIQSSLDRVDWQKADALIIENVGNLVCPSSYDLGEDMKVIIISTAEGDDKPLKYPGMFRRASLMIINKTDLAAHCDFDFERVKKNALSINGDLEILEISCKTGQGIDDWLNWLDKKINGKRREIEAGKV